MMEERLARLLPAGLSRNDTQPSAQGQVYLGSTGVGLRCCPLPEAANLDLTGNYSTTIDIYYAFPSLTRLLNVTIP